MHRFCSARGLALVSFLILIALTVIASPVVRGAPQDYTWYYNTTNVYTNHTLNYNLTGLDSATQYTFQIQLMDEAENLLHTIDTAIIGPGVTTATFGTGFIGFEDDYGPVRVIDNFEQVLGKHFVAPAYNADWQGSGGDVSSANKQGIGDVPYIALNAHGNQHPIEDHTAVLTRHGDWTLLHYRLEALVPPTDRYIRLYDSSSHAIVATFSMDMLYNYNRQNGTTFSPTYEGISFVVLNTDGSTLPFINVSQDEYAFTGSTYANPHELSVSPGVYQYNRYNGAGTLISIGESVWIVSSDQDGTEWDIGLKVPSVAPGGQQCASLYQTTPEVFNGYPDQMLSDSSGGISDDTDFSFDTFRRACFPAGGAAFSPATVTWRWQALSMVEASVVANDFRFEIEDTYEIIEDSVDAIVLINDGLSNFGLDSPIGNVIAMIAAVVGAMWLTRNPFVALIAFLGIGGFFVIFGLATPLTKVLFASGAILAIILFMRSMRTSGGTA